PRHPAAGRRRRRLRRGRRAARRLVRGAGPGRARARPQRLGGGGDGLGGRRGRPRRHRGGRRRRRRRADRPGRAPRPRPGAGPAGPARRRRRRAGRRRVRPRRGGRALAAPARGRAVGPGPGRGGGGPARRAAGGGRHRGRAGHVRGRRRGPLAGRVRHPREARGGTGLVGNFAELMAVDGEVDMTRFGRAAELEQGGTPGPQRTISEPRDYLERWARFEPAGTWRNVTISPNFPSDGRVMGDLYPQSGGRPVDGVIAVDPVGLAALLRFTGPIEVAGVPGPLTADDAAGFLLRDQYVVLDDTEQRIDALEALAETAFERLTTGDLPGPRRVADVLGPVVEGGHIQAYAVDEDQQRFFERLGLDGGLPPAEGDSLGVVVNNAVGNKVDLFLQRDVRYEVAWDPATGALEATATVTLTNDAPAAGLPDYVIGSALPPGERPPTGTNRTYLSIYSPWELEGARLDGEPVELERQREAGRYTYSLFVDVPPEGGTRTVELDLVGALPVGAGYELDVVAQPLVRPDRWSLVVEVAGDGEITAGDALAVEGRTVRSSGELTDRLTGYRIEVAR